MGRGLLAAVAVFLLAASGQDVRSAPSDGDRPDRSDNDTPRAGDLPIAGVVTNPDWLRKPGPDEFSQYYPPYGGSRNVGRRCLCALRGWAFATGRDPCSAEPAASVLVAVLMEPGGCRIEDASEAMPVSR